MGAGQYKETELLADFLTDVFVEGLGYRPPVARDAAGTYTLSLRNDAMSAGLTLDIILPARTWSARHAGPRQAARLP